MVGNLHASVMSVLVRESKEGSDVRTLAINGLQTDPIMETATLMAPRREWARRVQRD